MPIHLDILKVSHEWSTIKICNQSKQHNATLYDGNISFLLVKVRTVTETLIQTLYRTVTETLITNTF